MAKYRLVAVKLKSWTHPSLMAQGPSGILYYGRAPQNVGRYDPAYHEIVKEYGTLDDKDEAGWEAVEVQFARDNPPQTGVCDSPGWLAPDGVFYPCCSWEHDSMAWFLYRYVYGRNPETTPTREFEKLGWIRIYDNVFVNRQPLTQPQIDTLGELLLVTSSERMKRTIRWTLYPEAEDR